MDIVGIIISILFLSISLIIATIKNDNDNKATVASVTMIMLIFGIALLMVSTYERASKTVKQNILFELIQENKVEVKSVLIPVANTDKPNTITVYELTDKYILKDSTVLDIFNYVKP